jgi:hypothetical protein
VYGIRIAKSELGYKVERRTNQACAADHRRRKNRAARPIASGSRIPVLGSGVDDTFTDESTIPAVRARPFSSDNITSDRLRSLVPVPRAVKLMVASVKEAACPALSTEEGSKETSPSSRGKLDEAPQAVPTQVKGVVVSAS